MGGNCGCGSERSYMRPTLGCLECGTPCCSTCAVPLESATYCHRCAGSLLEATNVRAAGSFELY